MEWKAELFQELLCEELGDRRNIRTGALVALKGRFVWAVEDKEGMYRKRKQSKQAVVERSQRWICSTFSRLDLEQPDGGIDCDSDRSSGLLKLLHRKF